MFLHSLWGKNDVCRGATALRNKAKYLLDMPGYILGIVSQADPHARGEAPRLGTTAAPSRKISRRVCSVKLELYGMCVMASFPELSF